MHDELKNTLLDSMEKFQMESLRSKHRVMVSYLLFLYNKHPDLELEIFSFIFSSREGLYKQFIENQYSEILAEPYCNRITSFLIQNGYPTSFLDYKGKHVISIDK